MKKNLPSALYSSLLGAALWGLSGTAAQALFQNFGFPVLGLVSVRLVVAGALLFGAARPPKLPRVDLHAIVKVSIFGFVGSQLTYLFAIQFSNAATATLLQFLFLPMVAGYEASVGILRWSLGWTITLILSAFGTLFLIGGFTPSGGFQGLHMIVTPYGLVFGLLAAATGAYYTVASRPLVRRHGSWPVTTWGFVIGGLASLPFGAGSLVSYLLDSPLRSANSWVDVFALVVFVILFGTILGYGLYLRGLRELSATKAGVSASIEPIVAAAAAYAFLGVSLTPIQYLGGAMILLAVVLLSRVEVGATAKREIS